MAKVKQDIQEPDRLIFDQRQAIDYQNKSWKGLSTDLVEEISRKKQEPAWMKEFRLRSLNIYNSKPMPQWGPDISDLDLNEIITYIDPDFKKKNSWDEVPEEIKGIFTALGIPKAEQESLAGVGAQFDSEIVYQNMRNELAKEGVIYMDMETALQEYEDIIKEHFMKLVPPEDHKFAALHGAVWSGGSFVYVPEGVQVDIPLQSYFRLNAPGAGQFEHTLIIVEKGASLQFIEGCSAPKYSVNNLHAGCVELYVREGARLRYSTIENWSKNMYNLNTKRALVEKDGLIEWISGSFGSRVSMLYPMSILKGEGARAEFTGISFASSGQVLDTGAKILHAAPFTTSTISSRSIAKDGGEVFYRGLVKVLPEAVNSKASVSCESLMLDSQSRSDTVPVIDIRNDQVDFGHEAKVGRISEEAIYYLMSRGISEEEARALIVRGFVEPIAREFPLEYAVELNNLIKIELEGTIG